jgi:hypothetical protein
VQYTPEHLLTKDNTAYYYFKRWIWVQFPWIALANTELALKYFGRMEPDLVEGPETDNMDNHARKALPEPSPRRGNKKGPMVEVKTRKRNLDPLATFRRMWLVKKQDPSRVSRINLSPLQFGTMVKACINHLSPSADNVARLVEGAYADKADLSMRLVSRKYDTKPVPR